MKQFEIDNRRFTGKFVERNDVCTNKKNTVTITEQTETIAGVSTISYKKTLPSSVIDLPITELGNVFL